MSSEIMVPGDRWVRSADGYIAGVCEGLGKRFGIDPWALRVLWLVAVCAFGTGAVLYLVLAWSLPREDRLQDAHEKRLLGVCTQLSRRLGLEIGLVRALTVLVALMSFGATILVYFVLYLTLPQNNNSLIV